MSLGNIVGSNIFNVLAILGISSVVQPLATTAAFGLDLWIMLGFSLLVVPFLVTRLTLSRWEGGLLVGLYAAYTAWLFRALTTARRQFRPSVCETKFGKENKEKEKRMTTSEKEAVATLCLMAAFADGQKGDEEREHIKAVVDTLEGVSTPALYQKVLLNRVTLEEAAGALERPETRSLAFEMAVGVCDADGVMNPSERAFLEKLASALGLSDDARDEVEKTAETLAAGALSERPAGAATPVTPVIPVTPTITATESGDALSSSTPDETELDAMILNHAVLAGALELLPQSLGDGRHLTLADEAGLQRRPAARLRAGRRERPRVSGGRGRGRDLAGF